MIRPGVRGFWGASIPPSIARVSPRRLPTSPGCPIASFLSPRGTSDATQHPAPDRRAPTPTDPTTRSEAPRLRTVTGNPFPRKCACGCGGQIPRDPQLRYVVDFSGPKPFKTYLREHSPDFGSARGGSMRRLVPPTSSDSSSRIGLRTSLRTRESLASCTTIRHDRRDTVSRDEKSRAGVRPPVASPGGDQMPCASYAGLGSSPVSSKARPRWPTHSGRIS